MSKKEETVSKVISISEEMYFHRENKKLIEKYNQKDKTRGLNAVVELFPKSSSEEADRKSKKAA